MPHPDPAYRRYLGRSVFISVAYIASVALAAALLPDDAEVGPLVIALALLPGLALIGWVWAMARLLIELNDEYLRMLEVRKVLVATGLVLAVTGAWGLVELFADVPRLPVFFVFPIWCLGLVAGQLFNRMRGHSGAGACP